MVSKKQNSKQTEPKKEKKIKTPGELSAIAMKAVEARRKNHPEWGAKKRDNDATKKEKK